MMEWIILGLVFGPIALYIPFLVRKRRRDRRVAELTKPHDPAFEWKLDMSEIRADSELWIGRLKGSVTSVHAMSAPEFTEPSGTYGSGSVRPCYRSFLVDSAGEAHDLEKGPSWEQIEANASWLAGALDARFDTRI